MTTREDVVFNQSRLYDVRDDLRHLRCDVPWTASCIRGAEVLLARAIQDLDEALWGLDHHEKVAK